MAQTDNDIVAAILAGETQLFEILVARYQKPLTNFVYQMLHQYEEALDLTQEVFIKVYHALDRFDPSYKFSTWIFRIAQNAAIDYARKRRLKLVSLTAAPEDESDGREMELPSGERTAYEGMRNKELAVAIDRAIASLPEDYRTVIALRHFAELSYEEIARMQNMPLGTVKNKLFRGRALLKQRLEDFLGG